MISASAVAGKLQPLCGLARRGEQADGILPLLAAGVVAAAAVHAHRLPYAALIQTLVGRAACERVIRVVLVCHRWS